MTSIFIIGEAKAQLAITIKYLQSTPAVYQAPSTSKKVNKTWKIPETGEI